MMYRVDEYGERATYHAQCPEEWKGREFHLEEVCRFAVGVLSHFRKDFSPTSPRPRHCRAGCG